jgi:AcrR family transcriptional regulator
VSTRDRIVTATAELFRRHGYGATSMKMIVEASDAPAGSVYHFFKGGKEELAEVVITTSGAVYQQLFEAIFDAATDAPSAITDFFDGAADVLAEADYLDICPIGSVALEVASTNDRLRAAAAEVFAAWQESAQIRLCRAGMDADAAAELASALVAAIEGGFMLSRTARDPEPLRATGRVMRRAVEAALTPSRAARRRGVHP